MDIKFSIIVPVYNGEPYLSGLFENLSSCSYANYEVILVDDGSKDQSLRILSEYAAGNPHAKVVHQANSGIWAARNTGLDNSTGDYILFSDQDDVLFVSKLAALNNEILSHDYPDVVCAQAEWVEKDTMKRREPGTSLTETAVNRLICRGDIIAHLCLPMILELRKYASEPYYIGGRNSYVWHCAFRRAFLLKNNIRFIRGRAFDDDYFFKLAVYSRAQTAYLSDMILYRWYIHGASRSHTVKYVPDYYEKSEEVTRFEMQDVIGRIVEDGFLKLDQSEIEQIACDKYWWSMKAAIDNECLAVNPCSLAEKIRNLKKIDPEKTNAKSVANDSPANRILWLLLKDRAYLLLLLYGKTRASYRKRKRWLEKRACR